MKKVLTIAGSDCSGGAGVQADLKTFAAHRVFGMSVIVSVVAENTSRVIDIHDVAPEIIEKQIDAVFEDIEVDAVKIGMLSTPEGMRAVAKKLQEYKPKNVVIDPVMYAKNSCPLMDPSSVGAFIKTIIPLADVLTPNIPEAEKISGMEIHTIEEMEEAAKKIYDMGCKAVIVKGGHSIGDAIDVLFDGTKISYFETARIDTKNTHGTGCTFSSAIASWLARGLKIDDAVKEAKKYVTMAITHSLAIGHGNGPTNHFYDLYRNEISAKQKIDYSIYLVTDQHTMTTGTLAEAVEQAIQGGCTMIQLREKEMETGDFYCLAKEIKQITDRYDIPLIINDRIDIAMSIHAAGVHLGHSDMPAAVARRIIGNHMILGVSATSLQEAQQAITDGADYLGVGAMFPTQSKADAKYVSLQELAQIRQQSPIPMVVIGGINKKNAALFRQMKIDGLAVISAIIGESDIKAATAELKVEFLSNVPATQSWFKNSHR